MGIFDWLPFGNKNPVEVAQKEFDKTKQNLEVAQKEFDKAKQNLEETTAPAAPTQAPATTGGKSKRHKNKPHKKTRRPKH